MGNGGGGNNHQDLMGGDGSFQYPFEGGRGEVPSDNLLAYLFPVPCTTSE